MAVEKNFVVKNGLEVNADLLVANQQNQRVGVKTYIPDFDLEVSGGIGATDLYVGSASTVVNEVYVGSGTTDSFYANISATGISSVGINTRSPRYTLDVQGPVSTGQTALFVHGDTYITGTLNVGGASSEGSDIIIDGNVEIIGISTFEQHVDINNTLNVVGFATFNNVAINTSLTVIGISSLNNLYVGGGSTFVGFVTFNDSINVEENLYVGGISTFVGFATFGDSVSINNNLEVGDNVTIGDSLYVGGASTFIGVTSFMDNIYVDGDITFTGDLFGDGSALSGIVTQIVPGPGVNISPVSGTGVVQVSASGTDFVGNIGISTGSPDPGVPDTFIGVGVTNLVFQSTTGTGVTVSNIVGGASTVSITPGISIGLAIALGGK